MPHTWAPDSITPQVALQRLIDGNRRFREGNGVNASKAWDPSQAGVPQRPFAIILGCSDSRTPVETLFDQGFGDLFVVRVAGNIVAPSIVGSIEFAASEFGTRLVVVMGHTRCGAIGATLRALDTGLGPESKNIRDITDRIGPHIQEISRSGDPVQVMSQAVRANVTASTDHLRHGSRLLEELVSGNRVAIVGAEYELDTGIVHFFDTRAVYVNR